MRKAGTVDPRIYCLQCMVLKVPSNEREDLLEKRILKQVFIVQLFSRYQFAGGANLDTMRKLTKKFWTPAQPDETKKQTSSECASFVPELGGVTLLPCLLTKLYFPPLSHLHSTV